MTKKLPHGRGSRKGFTLFEVLLALGVFALAVTGLVIAIDTTLGAALEARQRSLCRAELESRLAYCLADPPVLGTRSLTAEENHGFRVEESLTPWAAKTARGTELGGMQKLTVTVTKGTQSDTAEILLYRP